MKTKGLEQIMLPESVTVDTNCRHFRASGLNFRRARLARNREALLVTSRSQGLPTSTTLPCAESYWRPAAGPSKRFGPVLVPLDSQVFHVGRDQIYAVTHHKPLALAVGQQP